MMPIFYNKDKKEWYLKDMEQEELDFLVSLGKEQFIKNLSLAMVQRFMPVPSQDEEQIAVLESMNPNDMGQA